MIEAIIAGSIMERAIIGCFVIFVLCLLAWALGPCTGLAPYINDDE